MPTQTVRDILATDLGADWKDRLTWLDGAPTAAASIGQVHEGRWHDGRRVAVKVQYPNAGDALMADLRTLARAARAIGPLIPGVDMKPLVEEVQARAKEEPGLPGSRRRRSGSSRRPSVTTRPSTSRTWSRSAPGC
ncbi:AarF/UbiB family protein [Nocardioides convexus]|uniref:AarF/UbiB family protein n=1 Tax=Nocardioides convexus TaxID=2712224 RepID=UPI0024188D4C|nr:AarF/UbiB family protein [Nocardioides convexus]